MKTTPAKATALETFEARRDNLVKNARRFATMIEQYDRAVSIAGQHQYWDHAGTLGHAEELLKQALEAIASATVNTHRRHKV